MRIDVYLFQNGFAQSRTEARGMVESGFVFVGDREIRKPSYEVSDDGDVNIKIVDYEKKYVSRGGFKLECAIKNFDFRIDGVSALDVGASSGGFTDCLLQNGAARVIALDSGRDQLAKKLRSDERVTVIENYNARNLSPTDLPYAPTLCVMDVSFISATYIIACVYNCLADGGDFVCLIKPQFEVGRSNVGKGGIVRDERVRRSAVAKVVEFAEAVGFKTCGVVTSDVVGGDGNIEFLAHFKKQNTKTSSSDSEEEK